MTPYTKSFSHSSVGMDEVKKEESKNFMKIIVFANQKGGVGKTSSAVAAAAILRGRRGYKTLLIDADSQCNSTMTYRAQSDGVATVYDLVVDDEPCSVEEAIQHTQYGDIIAGDKQLSSTDNLLAGVDGAFFRLRDALQNLSGYDYVIIDTNPSLNTMLYNALTVADVVVAPMRAEQFSADGLSAFTETLSQVKAFTNPKIRLEGFLLVSYDGRANLYRSIRESMEAFAPQIGTKVFRTAIRRSVKLAESQEARMPLLFYAPKSPVESDYESFVDELIGEETV